MNLGQMSIAMFFGLAEILIKDSASVLTPVTSACHCFAGEPGYQCACSRGVCRRLCKEPMVP